MRTLIVAVCLSFVTACAMQRQQQLQEKMDAEYAQCQTGNHDACERYKLLLRQYQIEVSTPRCGLLGLPCPGATVNVNTN